MENIQFYRQIGLRLLYLLLKMRLFLQLSKRGCQLLVEGTDDLLVLLPLLVLDHLTLAKLLDHPFVGNTPILQGLHMHQRLE